MKILKIVFAFITCELLFDRQAEFEEGCNKVNHAVIFPMSKNLRLYMETFCQHFVLYILP